MTPESAVILLVEDLEDDIILIRKAFAKANLSNPLHAVKGGEQAIAYLRGEIPFTNRKEYPLPDLILLDLKMPGIDGFETLRWIRSQPDLRGIPVIVLTTSEDLRDVNKAYAAGANSFLLKPFDFNNSVELARLLHDYWLKFSRLPENSSPAPKTGEKSSGPAN
jgi:CheY-like chemotaxis protein